MTGPLVVLGDTLLDVDVHGSVTRTVPDSAAAPVLDVQRRVPRPGGAGLAALLAVADGIPVRLVTALCADEAGDWLTSVLADRVDLVAGPAGGSTCVKLRVLDGRRPLLRMDQGQGLAAAATPAMRAALAGAGAVLVADYGRGATRDESLRAVLAGLVDRVPVVWDPHPRGGTPVPGCAVVTPNLAEAVAVLGPTRRVRTEVPAALHAASALVRRWRVGAVAVTAGAHGAALATGDDRPRLLPATSVPAAADTCGAGDRFAAALAGALRAGAGPVEATAEAVSRAGRFVAAGGAGAVRLTGAAPPIHLVGPDPGPRPVPQGSIA